MGEVVVEVSDEADETPRNRRRASETRVDAKTALPSGAS
jgi:hypothetical protein